MVLPSYDPGIFFLPTRDNRFVVVLATYPSQMVKASELFRCGLVYDQMARVARQWDAADLEAAGQDTALPISMVRTQEEFAASDHWRYHAATPLIRIEKIGESDPEPLPPSSRPLAGVRTLGMTHVVADPVVLRQLAAAGVDCLNLNMPDYTEVRMFYMQSDAGVRQAILDARQPDNRKREYPLVRDADIFVENLRPQLAAREGYTAEDLAVVRPGIISARIKLNTVEGPWANWVGFDSSAGAFTGLYAAEGSLEQPRLPGGVNVVVDFLCGMLTAAAVQAALIRRAKEGGSYRITVTLAQVTTFEMSLGLNDKAQLLDLEALGPRAPSPATEPRDPIDPVRRIHPARLAGRTVQDPPSPGPTRSSCQWARPAPSGSPSPSPLRAVTGRSSGTRRDDESCQALERGATTSISTAAPRDTDVASYR